MAYMDRVAHLVLRLAALRWGGYLFGGRPHRFSDAELWAMKRLGIIDEMNAWVARLHEDQ